MSIKISSNIASLNAQRRLGEATSSLSSVYEKLSSGQRINRASDDAAGLAIADDLKAKSRIYTQAIRNGNDGISLLNIADSAIDTLSGVVTRIRELSEQAANGTYSNKQRQALDNEAQELAKEFKRITQTASFNTMKLFDGSLNEGIRLQLGIGAEGSISIPSEAFSLSSGPVVIGTGSFSNSFSTFSNDEKQISLGDLNSDGVLDLVTGSGNVRLGLGDGSFAAATLYTNGLVQAGAVSLGDLNSDGILDIVSAGRSAVDGSGCVTVLIGSGDGSFASPNFYLTPQSGSSGINRDIVLGDINGDGILDLVTTGNDYLSYGAEATVFIGTGDGSFTNQTAYTDLMYTNWYILGLNSNSVTLGDVNGDGILDMIASGRTYDYSAPGYFGHTAVLIGNGDGTFNGKSSYVGNAGNNLNMTTGDINGDGILDIVNVGYSGEISLLTGNGDGTFADAGGFFVSTSDANTVTLRDIDSDGTLDLITGHSNGNIYTLLGTGDGTFGNTTTYSTGFRVDDLTFVDLNGDGVSDLISSNQTELNIFIAETEESGSSEPLEIFSLQTRAAALDSMQMLDTKLENLAKQRGIIGASQSRIGIAISSLQSSRENFSAAESMIRNADIAGESANLIKTQILQQAAASVLSQANQQPQLAIYLLR